MAIAGPGTPGWPATPRLTLDDTQQRQRRCLARRPPRQERHRRRARSVGLLFTAEPAVEADPFVLQLHPHLLLSGPRVHLGD